jgi:hypothetical protein
LVEDGSKIIFVSKILDIVDGGNNNAEGLFRQ